jgi:cold shock CspA family protein
MKGTIKTYLPEKKYGFILGDDGKNYFFHASEFYSAALEKNISENAFVEFEQHATPKGYSAKKCSLINQDEVQKYGPRSSYRPLCIKND